MNRYTRAIDGSVPVRTQLYGDEELVSSQDGVGLYDGKDKSPGHQLGTVHITSHRLLYIDLTNPQTFSIALNLSSVRQTDYYAGFFKSSAKVTLVLGIAEEESVTPRDEDATPAQPQQPTFFIEAWICPICSYSNPPSANEGRPKCHLCGVTRDTQARPTPIAAPVPVRPPEPGFSQSLPTSPTVATFPEASSSVAIPPPTDTQEIPCPACTFLNHPSMPLCELCSTPLRARPRSPPPRPSTSTAGQASVPESSASTPAPESIKISFRNGGDKAFYAALKRTLLGKAWEIQANQGQRATVVGPGRSSTVPPVQSGIHGIMQAAQNSAKVQSEEMSSSLRDLEALMSKAKQMVQLAQSLNEKLSAQDEALARQKALYPDLPVSGATLPEDADFIRSSMARLGLPLMAVTQDMVKDDKEYQDELGKELLEVLLGSNTRTGMLAAHNGIIGLDEVWCGWNRARGVALVPPSSLVSVIPHLIHQSNNEINERTFKGGLHVLHTPQYAHDKFSSRLRGVLEASGPCSSVEIAREEGMSVGLTEEMVGAVEEDGDVVRDAPGGYEPVRWYPNAFRSLAYDGTLVT